MVVKFTINGERKGGWDHIRRIVKKTNSERFIAKNRANLAKIKGSKTAKPICHL